MGELNALIHQPTRLRIMAALASVEQSERVDFGFVRDLLELTDGNLSVHLQKLEEAGYVQIEKAFEGRRPKTWVQITSKGHDAFSEHIDALEKIVKQAGL